MLNFTWTARTPVAIHADRTAMLRLPAQGRTPVIGLALGGGSARGWAHIGVVLELVAQGIEPDVVAGTSVGAVVGGAWCTDRLDRLEAFARSMTRRRVFGMLDLSLSGRGLIGGARLGRLLEKTLGNPRIEHTHRKFAAVATEVRSGHEIWMTRGNMTEAIRASCALPGIFAPVRVGGRLLFDGALVNPVPVNVCRALGAEVVIAVNLISDQTFRGVVIRDHGSDADKTDIDGDFEEAPRRRRFAGLRRRLSGPRRTSGPGIASVMIDAFNITQDRIARARLAGDPPDVLVNARLSRFGLFDFHRADELIEHGREAVRRALPDLRARIAAAGRVAPVAQTAITHS